MASAPERQLLLATRNPGKLRELRARLAQTSIEVVGLGDVEGAPDDVAETGATFLDNAALKAVGYGAACGVLALADDSGLSVDALDGAPGVYSARFAGPDATDATNNALLLERLQDVPEAERTARFHCAVVLYVPPGEFGAALAERAKALPHVHALQPLPPGAPAGARLFAASAVAEGRMLSARRGEGGFGYDPLFLSDDLGVTFAEASAADKLTVSHRGRALDRILPLLTRG